MGSVEDDSSRLEEALIQDEESKLYTGDGSVDFKGRPVLKKNTGNWKACPFILGNECCERLAYYGIATNLVTYLTRKLHEGNVSAARNVTTWQGTCYLTPLIGAVLADSYWGRYWTIAIFSMIYFIGMCTLTLSASIPTLKPAECLGAVCPPATPAQYAVFFIGLYLIALGTGGIKPCVSSFGADQFDDTDSRERVKKGSFFNWFYFSINIGALISSSFIVWIQDNTGWGLGFGIPALFMGLAIGSFFLGTPLYRFQKPGGSPLTRMCQVVAASFRKRNLAVPEDSSLLYETPDKSSAIEGSRKLQHSDELRCLDRAAVVSDDERKSGDYSNLWRLCTVTQVEELKILIRMFPVWATGIVFSAVYAQMSTLFVEQGTMMDTSIGSFKIPPASLSTFDVISVIFWVPVYDSFIIPIARKFTGKERGFSELQRMGIGLFISVLCMSAAAIVEIKRLQLAKELDLVDKAVPVPLTILLQIPQYFLLGAAEVFTFVGQLEFFYDQSPDAMRSLCSALSLLTNSLGNYLSSFILTVVVYFTTRGGNPGWITDNLNKGHLSTVSATWMIPLGLSGAVSIRVSNELGAGHPWAARLAVCIVVVIGIIESILIGVAMILLRNIWGYAYSNEVEVVQYISKMMPILALSNFLDGLQCVLSGNVRGCGWQKIGAYVNMGSYYLVGIPLAIVLAFVLRMGGMGLWLGIICALIVQVFSLMIVTIRTDWEKQAKKATDRVYNSISPESLVS